LLKVFWLTHDPTTLNRQGGDVGTQYRSAVFYHSDEQKQTAEASRTQTEADKLWPNPIVTEITAANDFYAAENYHQNYFNQNGYQPYCMMVINPKVQKFRKAYAQLLKK
jgi:peptide-methionine (S)-S-oxide reductase